MALFRTETRIQLIGLFFLTAVSLVVGKLWWVQIAQGKMYAEKIKGNSQVTVRIPSVRGEIRDRNGLPLVTNRASYEVDFYLQDMVNGYRQAFGSKNLPRRTRQSTKKGVLQSTDEVDINKVVQDTVMPRLEELGFEQDYNAATLQTHYRNDTLVPFTFMEDLDFADMAKLSERDLGLPGVEVAVRPVRQYLYGSLGAHLLGYVGPVSTDKAEIKEDARNFTFYQADVEGKNNIEATMNKWLRGQPGVRYVKRNPKGVIEGDIGITPPTPGANVYMTIDARIQTIAEEALRVAGRGAAVVIDPNNGDVLAMASVPSFDPNTFIPSISGRDWSKLIKDETNPLTNRALLSYAPGSTFKTVTALAGLRKGIGRNKYNCSGGVTYGNKYMRCWIADKGGAHGTLGLEDSLKYSCNAFYYQYGNAAGIDQIDAVGAMLGIGMKSGIELTNEAEGVLPGPEWLALNQPKDRWSQGYTANTSIGQGQVLCSPLQMANVAATLANGGICYYPRIVDRILDKDGKDVLDEKGNRVAPGPRVRSSLLAQGLKPQDIELVRKGMWKVVNESGGTAGKAKIKNVEVAGKTGTAQFWRNGQKDNHTWFICFAPYDKPKYAICIFLQGAKSGGGTAAPIAARILDESLAMERGAFQPQVRPLAPAVGNFTFIANVDYNSRIGAAPAATPQGATTDEETENENDADMVSGENRNADRDRTQVAAPNVRADPDASGRSKRRSRVAVAQPVESNGEGSGDQQNNPFMRSMRKFFGRNTAAEQAGGDVPPTDDRDLKRQQKTLTKQRDQLRQRQSPNSAQGNRSGQGQSSPPPPPPRKKFLGVF